MAALFRPRADQIKDRNMPVSFHRSENKIMNLNLNGISIRTTPHSQLHLFSKLQWTEQVSNTTKKQTNHF